MKYHVPYLLWKRKYDSGIAIYFYNLFDEATNKRIGWKSTGKSKKNEAIAFIENLLIQPKRNPEANKTIGEIATTFFNDDSEFVRLREGRKGPFSLNYFYENRRMVNRFIIPFFGNIQISKASTRIFESIILKMKDNGVKIGELNKSIVTLKIIFKELERREVILRNPARLISPFKMTSKPKDVFNELEIVELFNPNRIEEIWTSKMFYILNRLLACTGLRISEALGLMSSDLKRAGEISYLFIHQTSSTKFKGVIVNRTKNGKNREVLIHPKMEAMLSILIRQNVEGPFIFSKTLGLFPVKYPTVVNNFQKALHAFGINERNITLHSWRHFYNTLLKRSHVPLNQIMQIVGHATTNMSDHYTQPLRIEEMPDVLKAQDSLFIDS
jgi:integrase